MTFTEYREPQGITPLQLVVLQESAKNPHGACLSTGRAKVRLIAQGYLEVRVVPDFLYPMPVLTEKGWAELKKEGGT